VQGCAEKETNEVYEIPFADASAHPRAVVVLILHADVAPAAMERARWLHDAASRAHCQFVCVSARVYDLGHLELVLIVEVLCSVPSKAPECLWFILDVDFSLFVVICRGDGRDYPWFSMSAFVDQSETVQH